MNQSDKRELLETAAIVLLIIVFLICCMICVAWGISYQILVLFSGFIGTLVGAFTQKMRSGNSQTTMKEGELK